MFFLIPFYFHTQKKVNQPTTNRHTQTASPVLYTPIPPPPKAEQACKYFWTVTVVTRSPHQDESAPGGSAPPADQAAEPLGISACVKLPYHVNSVQRIVIFFFLSLSLSLVVLLWFFFPSVFASVPSGLKVKMSGIKTQGFPGHSDDLLFPFAVFCIIVQMRKKYLFFTQRNV